MLYPTTTVDLAAMPAMNLLEPGSLLVIPLTVAPGSGLLCSMLQLSPTQDYSLRGWLSRLPCGLFLPTNTSYWHFDRYNEQQVAIYDRARDPLPATLGNLYPLAVAPGAYCLNILNVVNSENIFSFAAATLQS